MSDGDFVWVFNGENGRFPGGVFLVLQKAEEWISLHRLSGILTQYPLNQGSFDWALKRGWVPEGKREANDPYFIGSFTSASYEHFHYENGVKE